MPNGKKKKSQTLSESVCENVGGQNNENCILKWLHHANSATYSTGVGCVVTESHVTALNR